MKVQKIKTPIELLLVVVGHNMADKVLQELKKHDIDTYVQFFGRGTAKSELSDLFGFDVLERDVVLSFVPAQKSEQVLEELNIAFNFEQRHKGFALTVPINSAEKQLLDIFSIRVGERVDEKDTRV